MGLFLAFIHLFESSITLHTIERILEGYRGTGPFMGIFLPMLEAIFPFIPLVVLVIANAAAYGFFMGFLLSWLGSSIGSIAVFLIIRKIARNPIKRWVQKHEKMSRMLEWVEEKGFGPLFIIYCFPFTPSAIINVVAGLATMGFLQFILAVLFGKMVLIAIITYLGNDWESILSNPYILIPIILLVVVLWLVGKGIEKQMTKKTKVVKNQKRQDQEN